MKYSLLFYLCLALALAGCSSSSKQQDAGVFTGLTKPALALVPQARFYTGEITPVITHINPNSVADRFHFRVGDQLVSLNSERITSASEFDAKIRHAPTISTISFRRGGKIYKTQITLGMERPRFGAGFEPIGVAWVKKSSPFVSFMYQRDLLAYAETSVNKQQNLLHLNIILDSKRPIALPRIKYSVYDRGTKSSVSSGFAQIDALGSGSQIFSKAFSKKSGFKGPISVALDVEGKQFHFEFQ